MNLIGLLKPSGLLLLTILASLTVDSLQHDGCPVSCNCTKVKNGPFIKVRCTDKIDVLSKLNLSPLVPQVAQLDLSKNTIEDVGAGYFVNFTNLKRLDLSFNRIGALQDHAFKGLDNLDVLKLSNNNLTELNIEVLSHVRGLKKLDISNNTFECDCTQSWLLDWAHNFSIKLSPMPKCVQPIQARGLPFTQWYEKSLPSCHSHVPSVDILRLHPQQDQVVFEGDRLQLQCQAPLLGINSSHISWFWGKHDPLAEFQDVRLESVHLSSNNTLQSSLIIDRLTNSHSGQWNCLLVSGHSNHSRTVTVIVISAKTLYCPQSVVRNNKGAYAWPQTVAGVTAELPCQATDLGTIQRASAYQECGADGRWRSLNTSLCPFASETTRLLQDFSKMNLSVEHGPAIVESARRLLNLSSGGPSLSDKMDAIFLSRAINNYLKFLPTEKEVGSLLLDMVSCAVQMPRNVLKAAQLEDQACSKLVRSVETVMQFSSPLQSQWANLAVEEFRVTHESFLGITCIWYSVPSESEPIVSANKRPSRIFHCSQGNNTAFLYSRDKVIDASIQIPSSLFYQLEMQGMPVQPIHQLIISMYGNSHLFPRLYNNDSSERWDVASSVIGAKLVGMKVQNLADPIYIVVRAPVVREAGGWARPVWWDDDLNSGTGGWSEQGCTLSHLMNGKLVFSCDKFGYFGLLQEIPFEFERRVPRSLWQLSHPAIYIGSCILVISLIITIVTYIVAGPHIQMPKRTKHSLINTWIAISLLSFIFCVGVHQTDDVDLCQSVGMILHYLTLSTLLWMAVTVSNMRKSLRKKHPLEIGSEDDIAPSSTPQSKPLLGLYLVGWGIGLMVVGVSGAVNLKQYRYFVQDEYCFLVPNSALGAVLVPCAAVIVYLLVCVVLVRCDIAQRQGDANAQLSDGTQGTENVDLELLDCALPAPPGISSASVASSVSSEVEDAEHTPVTQLRAALIVLLLFISLWAAGALSTASQLHAFLPHAQLIFGTLYAVTAFLLATFVLFFHCFARSDVRPCWQVVRCRGRNVRDAHAPELQQRAPETSDKMNSKVPISDKVSNVERNLITHRHEPASHLVSSSTSINSNKSHRLRAAVELNKAVVEPSSELPQGPTKTPIMHHLMPKYRSYPNVTDAEVFYNPRQSDMARKFFRKQKRLVPGPHIHLDARRQGDGEGNPSDIETTLQDSLKGFSSKVSNTNIHVEPQTDDAPDHIQSSKVLNNHGRLVIGADSPPHVNNDGTVRGNASDSSHFEARIGERNSSRRRRSRGFREMNGYHNRPKEKCISEAHNGVLNGVSSKQDREIEMDGDIMKVSILDETLNTASVQRVASYPWDNSSVVSGASFSIDRGTGMENENCSMSLSSRRSSRSPSSRKKYKRCQPAPLRSHPTSLASSVVSLQIRDARLESDVNSCSGFEDPATKAKKETCV